MYEIEEESREARRGSIRPVVLTVLAGALLGTLMVRPGWAAGQIHALGLSPTPACKGQPVTATVQGTGNCNKVVIRWEGTGPQAVKDVLQPPPGFPIHRQHVYDHTGQVTVKVAGGSGSNCQGQKQKSLTIQDCSPPPVPMATGSVTGLSLSPLPACTGEPVTATVSGTGFCQRLEIVWEGSGPQAVKDVMQPPPSFPVHQQHVYPQAGQVTVVAQGGENSGCPGLQQKSVTVLDCPNGGGGDGGGLILDPRVILSILDKGPQIKPGALAPKPRITAALGVLQGGAPLIVGGQHFGTTPGTVRLKGASGERLLAIDEWYEGGIGGTVPADIQSICPTGEIQVVTDASLGAKPSNLWKVVVPWKIQHLPMAAVKVVSCGSDGNVNHCNGQSGGGGGCGHLVYFEPAFFGQLPTTTQSGPGDIGRTVYGYHANCWGAIGDDSGYDVYEVTLKNGWEIDSATFTNWVSEAGEASTVPLPNQLPAGLDTGASHWKGSIGWMVTPNDAVAYYLDIDIIGPACAPFQ